MPRGDKSAYTDKQKRQAEHIEEGYERRGVSEDEAERRAWATVNKETGGGRRAAAGAANRKTMRHRARAASWVAKPLRRDRPPRGQLLRRRQPPPANERPRTVELRRCCAITRSPMLERATTPEGAAEIEASLQVLVLVRDNRN